MSVLALGHCMMLYGLKALMKSSLIYVMKNSIVGWIQETLLGILVSSLRKWRALARLCHTNTTL